MVVTPFVGVWIETHRKSLAGIRQFVTPFVGVWIETVSIFETQINIKSHPSWVCGLKQNIVTTNGNGGKVTPFVGVWIETHCTNAKGLHNVVTPFVGVWIETAS